MMIAYICFIGMPTDIEFLTKHEYEMRAFFGIFASTYGVYTALDIIEGLCQKAGIENTIANLEYNLELAKLGDGGDEDPEVEHKL